MTTMKRRQKNGLLLELPGYDPNRLLDAVLARMNFGYDRELAEALDMMPNVISRIRTRMLAISPAVIVGIMDVTGMSLAEIRALAGIPTPQRY